MTQPPPGYPAGPQPGRPNSPTQHLPAPGRPPQGPPPGAPQGPPPGYPAGPPPFPHGPHAGPHAGPPAGPLAGPARSKAGSAVGVLALISLAATVIGLTVNEDGRNAWDTVNAWGAVAILGAVLTFAPLARGSLNLSAHRAWQVAACGAGALALFWVLFVLPSAGSNTSLVITVGAAAGIIAAWVAPGREDGPGPSGPAW
jgi:hypothetical protein